MRNLPLREYPSQHNHDARVHNQLHILSPEIYRQVLPERLQGQDK
jgi:hypothetical protein